MFRGSLFVTLALLFAGAAPSASAQQIHFSFGHGHHHGGHHYDHYWHGCHDPFWCGPSVNYVYAAPPPVVRREIRYVQPVEQVIETRVETPRAAAAPRNATALASSAAESPLQIWNSAGQRASVAFLTDGQQVSLGDGQSHTFYGGGTRTVEFDRGGDFGTARMQLTSGQYDFVVTAGGWDLVRRADGVSPIALRPLAPKNPLPSEATRR